MREDLHTSIWIQYEERFAVRTCIWTQWRQGSVLRDRCIDHFETAVSTYQSRMRDHKYDNKRGL